MEQQDSTTFIDQLERTPDPRRARGRSYEWRVLLAVISAALVSGQATPCGIAQWVRERKQALVAQLRPAKGRLPGASTIYRVLRKVNRKQLEMQVAGHNQGLDDDDAVTGGVTVANGELLRGQAVDGKAVRGANKHGMALHLVSLVRHESGCVLNQCAVAAKSNEISAVPRRLAGRDLRGTVTTMDALLTQRARAHQIGAQHGYYLLVVTENQPTLYAQIQLLFNVPPVPVRPGELLTYSHTEAQRPWPLGDAHLGVPHSARRLPGLAGGGPSHAPHLSARDTPHRCGEQQNHLRYHQLRPRPGVASANRGLLAGPLDHRKQSPLRPR